MSKDAHKALVKAKMQLAREVRADTSLLPSYKVIFDELIDRVGDYLRFRLSDADLATACGVGVDTIGRACNALKDRGLICKKRTRGIPTYTFPTLEDDTAAVRNHIPDVTAPMRNLDTAPMRNQTPDDSAIVSDLNDASLRDAPQKTRERRTRICADAMITPDHIAVAAEYDFGWGRANRMFSMWKSDRRSRDKQSADWMDDWRLWCMRQVEIDEDRSRPRIVNGRDTSDQTDQFGRPIEILD